MRALSRAAVVVVLVQVVALAGPGAAQAQDKADGEWKSLFNGKNTDGWLFKFGKGKTENDGIFTVKDGVLHCKGKPSGYMYTKESYSSYTFEAEMAFVRPAGLESDAKFRGNSGVLIHVSEGPGIGVWPRSIEVQGMHRQLGLILPIPRNLQCKKTDDKAARAKAVKPVGEWNKLVIEVTGGDMDINLNGTLISTVRDCELTKGPIGLQSEGAPTRWRNIRIKKK